MHNVRRVVCDKMTIVGLYSLGVSLALALALVLAMPFMEYHYYTP